MAEVSITDWTKLGAAVRDARARRSWSQHELAHSASVSRSWLARVEAGHRGAELEPLLRLLTALDLTITLRDRAGPDPSRTASTDPAETSAVTRKHSAAQSRGIQAVNAEHEAVAAERRRSWTRASTRE